MLFKKKKKKFLGGFWEMLMFLVGFGWFVVFWVVWGKVLIWFDVFFASS